MLAPAGYHNYAMGAKGSCLLNTLTTFLEPLSTQDWLVLTPLLLLRVLSRRTPSDSQQQRAGGKVPLMCRRSVSNSAGDRNAVEVGEFLAERSFPPGERDPAGANLIGP